MAIKRLKYVSRFAERMSEDQIQEMADKAAADNQARGITGVLMTTGGLFFQVIEGPDDEVDALFARIAIDPRHTDVALLGVEQTEDRLFSDWGMKALNLDTAAWRRAEPLRELLQVVLQQRDAMDTLSGFLERAIWEEIRKT